MKPTVIGLLLSLVFGMPVSNAHPPLRSSPTLKPEWQSAAFDSSAPPVPQELRLTDQKAERPFIFWIGAGFGYGAAGRVCEACDEPRHPSGSSFQGKLGFAVSKRILIGMEAVVWVNGWGVWNAKDGLEGKKIYRNHFLLMSYLYPLKRERLFTKFGFGLSSYTAYNRYLPYADTLPSEVHGDGLGLAAGAGYDVKIARQLYISPSVTYFHGNLGNLTLNNRSNVAANRKLNLIDFNAALTFHAPK